MPPPYIKKNIALLTIETINSLYKQSITEKDFIVNVTKPEFEGAYTIVLFSLSKKLNISIPTLAQALGDALVSQHKNIIAAYNIKQGFLNLSIADSYLIAYLQKNYQQQQLGKKAYHGKKVMVEYSSPNTNKPLHLGHLRNNFLGYSIAKIYEWNGYDVFTACVVNDRGIHICKSMYAWQKWGEGKTPEITHKKGDHFVGDYYVLFSNELKKEINELKIQGIDTAEAEKKVPLMKAVQEMLVLWEKGDDAIIKLWKIMNEWVYKGFEETYKKIGTTFKKIYYESNTYLLGKEIVEQGLKEKYFFKKEDGSIWVDLQNDGLDQKLLLRKDGTSVYITQDLGLADLKYKDFEYENSIYVVGDEQNYHFQVLQLILKKMKKKYAEGIFHLSYGMVELPTGKMKSREGTVVDADDLIDEMVAIAKENTIQLGKVQDFNPEELNILTQSIGMAALKFFLLKVDAKKKMLFNPQESIDFQGFTGPFIQYTFARIQSVLKKANADIMSTPTLPTTPLEKIEKELLIEIDLFEYFLEQSLIENNPSIIANYAYSLSKKFNTFYAQHSILQMEQEEIKILRLKMAQLTSLILLNCADILGFSLPHKM